MSDIGVPLVICFGISAVAYGLSIQKEKPIHSSAIFSVLGASAALVGLASAAKSMKALKEVNAIAANLR